MSEMKTSACGAKVNGCYKNNTNVTGSAQM